MKIKHAFIILLVIAMTVISVDANARTAEYHVITTSNPCPQGSAVARASKTSWWAEPSDGTGVPVYVEEVSCDGHISRTGTKPSGIVAGYDTVRTHWDEIWEEAQDISASEHITIAEAVSLFVPPTRTKDSVDVVGDPIKLYWFDLTSVLLPIDLPSDLVAITGFNVSENRINVETNKPIEVQIVDLTTGLFIGERLPVYDSKVININNLSSGCKYTLNIHQNIEGYGNLIIKNYHFCK